MIKEPSLYSELIEHVDRILVGLRTLDGKLREMQALLFEPSTHGGCDAKDSCSAIAKLWAADHKVQDCNIHADALLNRIGTNVKGAR